MYLVTPYQNPDSNHSCLCDHILDQNEKNYKDKMLVETKIQLLITLVQKSYSSIVEALVSAYLIDKHLTSEKQRI